MQSITKQLDAHIKIWLNERGITDEVITDFNISYNGRSIVIPVCDDQNNFLYNKYRRDPRVNEGNKYSYDKGSKAELFNAHLLRDDVKQVIFCEGEFDSLVLIANGFVAVSSTGGASTFDLSWVDSLQDKEVFICLDNDEAGYKGSFKILMAIPGAKIIWLPVALGEGGDVTDFFCEMNGSKEDFERLMLIAKRYDIPEDFTEKPKTKKAMKEYIKKDKDFVNGLVKEKNDIIALRENHKPIDILIEAIMGRISRNAKILKYMGKRRDQQDRATLESAKEVPIDQYIEFNRAGYAPCIWHNESTPSMFYYREQNRVKCFGGCGQMGDVIDVIQRLNSCNVPEAIKIILKK